MSGCSSSWSVDPLITSWSLTVCTRDLLTYRCGGQPTRDPEGTGEGSSPHGEVVTLGGGVQVCAPAGCGAGRIGYDDQVAVRIQAGGHPQQLALGGPLATTHARADRSLHSERGAWVDHRG